MKLIIDAQISPAIASWINRNFIDIQAISVRSVELQFAKDTEIYNYAKENGYVIMSKDDDFLSQIEKHGSPPALIWVTCGNTSNARMREILTSTLLKVKTLIDKGEPIVEISDV
jgi:predicted nuclease of predicted toxin-antitoxin system